MFSDVLRKKKIFYEFLTFLSIQCCKSVAYIIRCMCVCTNERFDYPCFIHRHLENKHGILVYIHTSRLEAGRGTSNIHTKSRQALFKRPQSKLNNVK